MLNTPAYPPKAESPNLLPQLQALVPAPGAAADFAACLDAFPVLEYAKVTPQSAKYHGEGDVWTHTKMVVQELLQLPEYAKATPTEREILFFAALLHDVSKYRTSVLDVGTGQIGHPGHSKKGAVEARELLWDWQVPLETREHICRLIAVHQKPFFALAGTRAGQSAEFIVRELSWQVSVPLLGALAKADMLGRVCADTQAVLDNIELFCEMAKDEDCYGKPRHFVDAHTRVSYFRGASVHPDYPLFQEPGSKVTVMCGMPASGKDTWVRENRPGFAVVSFDDAREELGLKHGRNEGMVAHRAVDKAKEMLRAHAPFIWNATHLSAQMRQKTLDLLYAYNAEVELVYLESPRATLLQRNSKRDTSLTNKDLQAMTSRWEVPLPSEAHRVSYQVGTPSAVGAPVESLR